MKILKCSLSLMAGLILSGVILSSCATPYGAKENSKEAKDQVFCEGMSDGFQEATNRGIESNDELYLATGGYMIERAAKLKNNVGNSPEADRAKLDDFKQALYKKLQEEKGKKEEYRALYRNLSDCRARYMKSDPRRKKLLENFMDAIKEPYYSQEQKLFLKRTGGKKICETALSNMLIFASSPAPTKDCLYYAYGDGRMDADQVTRKGILVSSFLSKSRPEYDRRIFIYSGNSVDDTAVDGSAIQQGLFEYVGPLTYDSMFGERTVWSFKRVEVDALFKDILFYRGY